MGLRQLKKLLAQLYAANSDDCYKKVYEGERRGWKGFKRLLMKAQPEDKDALRVILELYKGKAPSKEGAG